MIQPLKKQTEESWAINRSSVYSNLCLSDQIISRTLLIDETKGRYPSFFIHRWSSFESKQE